MNVDELKLREDNKLYPPRFIITIWRSSAAEDSYVDITFEGATQKIVKRFSLTKGIARGIVNIMCRLLVRCLWHHEGSLSITWKARCNLTVTTEL